MPATERNRYNQVGVSKKKQSTTLGCHTHASCPLKGASHEIPLPGIPWLPAVREPEGPSAGCPGNRPHRLGNRGLQMSLPTEALCHPSQRSEVQLHPTHSTPCQQHWKPTRTQGATRLTFRPSTTGTFGRVQPQGAKKTEMEAKPGSIRKKIPKQTALTLPHSFLMKKIQWNPEFRGTLPIPPGFWQLRENLSKTTSLEVPTRLAPTTVKGSPGGNGEFSIHLAEATWAPATCQTRRQTPAVCSGTNTPLCLQEGAGVHGHLGS